MKHQIDKDLKEDEGVSMCRACYADEDEMKADPKCPGWYYDAEIHEAKFVSIITHQLGRGSIVTGIVKNDKGEVYLDGAFVQTSRIIERLPDGIVQTRTRRYKVFLKSKKG
tara:strand:- start:160 stop:492 length:333 start_codon:yes stop_codon:yes gene_type:complete